MSPIGKREAPISPVIVPHSGGAPAVTRIYSKYPSAMNAPARNPKITMTDSGLRALDVPVSTVAAAISCGFKYPAILHYLLHCKYLAGILSHPPGWTEASHPME